MAEKIVDSDTVRCGRSFSST